MSKILFVLGRDVYNKPAYPIYNELIKRGNSIDVYAVFYEEMHFVLFRQDYIEIHRIEELKTKQEIEKYDYIYSAITIYDNPLFRIAERYIFCAPTSYMREIYSCGDFTFTVRKMEGHILENERWGIDECNLAKMAPCMATGSPMHEGLEFMQAGDNKTILFIDSGHFPCGGKREEAETIMQIAYAFPQYKIRIKPRFIRGDKSVTHRNDEYLVDYLDNDNLPNNVEIIREHTDLRKELESCYLLISDTMTTSYIEAVLASRKILLLEGFPNEESTVMNRKAVERQGKIAAITGCVVNYKDVLEYLPEGMTCSEEFINKFIYRHRGVTKSVVDAMEYIYQKFISQNRFPKEEFYCSENYEEKMEAEDSLSWKDIIQRRYRVYLYGLSNYDARINSDLDFSPFIESIEETRKMTITEENFPVVIHKLNAKLLEMFVQNREKLMSNALSQSVFFKFLYDAGLFSEIKKEEVLCRAYYRYLKAKECAKEEKYQECIDLIDKYFEEVNQNLFDRTLADEMSVKISGYYFRGFSQYNLGNYLEAKENLETCEKLCNGKHKKAKEYLDCIADILN